MVWEEGVITMNKIVEILIRRDKITKEEAMQIFIDAQQDLIWRLEDNEDADDICEEWFGLEPDYIFDLMEGM